ncbi:ATP-grasp fold protein [Natronomonas moolapensis 8.8.11]|uniref:ATP-grasp fold protein n=1 Tax=Natronomonas moolapensis (strain DSM 18674 / CECT 7526 / JCM 14361 / 8.8.11) TaxID=268739 RepID=M1XQD6_NATM8|nr:ATP-grasp domain-containing protein [Natronomonas moolapensis]CCQ36368.1 ATP-grasp fold protein [Natronomonas moolapensis 8.8.11]
MLRLAVATDAETLDRIIDPLAERGIEARYVPTTGRAQPLSEPLIEEGFDVGFVYPSRMMEGGVADALLGVPWVNDRAAVLRSRNKAETLARLKRAGVPTPKSVYVSNPAADSELRAAFDRLDPPVVVKPNSTTRGVGIAKAGDLDSFLGICEYLSLVHDYRAVDDRSFLLQEFLPAARDFRAMVVDGEYAGAVERRLPASERAAGRWKHNVHRGAAAVGVDLAPGRRKLAEAAAEALDIEWLGVDLLVAEGRAVVNETNARPTVDSATKYDSGFYDRMAGLIRRTADV